MKGQAITYFQAEDGSLYAGVQEHNGKISQLSQVVVKTNLIENVLDATLLVPERSKMVSTLVGEIFLMDSFAWLLGFIAAFIGLVPGPPPLLTSPELSIAVACTCGGVLVVTQVWNAMAPRLYYPDPDTSGGGGFWIAESKGSSTRNTRVFACFLCSLYALGLWYTVQTGSTLFARACLVQWAMSLGTILAIFRPRPPITSQDIHGTRPSLPSVADKETTSPSLSAKTRKRILIPGLLFGLVGSAFLAWTAGVVAEPHLVSAIITFLPIPLCIAYRYLWIVYMVIIPEVYRVDETVLAWSDFYFDNLRRITRLSSSTAAATVPVPVTSDPFTDTAEVPHEEPLFLPPPTSSL